MNDIGDDYTALLHRFQGEQAYGFLFDGQLGCLDYALASQSILDQVTGATVWHINADEPDIIDYDITFKQDAQDVVRTRPISVFGPRRRDRGAPLGQDDELS